jgi:hypothetical protein
MKFFASKNYTFYPDIQDNLSLPENERLAVEIKRPTAEERGELTYTEMSSEKSGETTINKYRQSFNVRRILSRHVGSVSNLTVEDSKEVSITSGQELATASFYGMRELVDAICIEVCSDTLTESEKKTC